ncbi:MAG: hypothetical protein M1814_003762 [Vezdaea aestivalis]|nr:MAG: hypothetical protein M1814_003762 [Vezdaea aestivalis]
MSSSSCKSTDNYNVSTQSALVSEPQLITGATCVGGYSGCQLGTTSGYAVTVTKRFGFTLGLAKIIGLGLTADVSVAKTDAKAISLYVACPSGYTCGCTGKATMWNVTGWKITECQQKSSACSTCKKAKFEQYEVHFPVLVPGTQKNAQAQVEYEACIVQGSQNALNRPPNIPLCPPFPTQPGYGNPITTD